MPLQSVRLRSVLMVAVVVLTLLYPAMVYVSLGRLAPQWVALLLSVVALARAWVTRRHVWVVVAVGACLLAAAAWWRGDALVVKFYPVLVNAVMLVVFASSLLWPPTMVERMARLREPDLPPAGVRYAADVTRVWCVFFVLNGLTSAYTGLYASDKAWALYNGLLSYLLMGGLMAVEWLVRQRMRRRYAQAKETHEAPPT